MRSTLAVMVIALVGCSGERPPSVDDVLGAASTPLDYQEQSTLAPPADESLGYFGNSLAIDGTTAIVSDVGDGAVAQAGYVYAYVRANGQWSLSQTLKPAAPVLGGHFGQGLALQSDTLMIGAPAEQRGAVYPWSRTEGTWMRGEALASDPSVIGSGFGFSIAVDGDVMVAGAPSDDAGTDTAGSVFVFARHGASWTQTDRIVPSDTTAGLQFGTALAIAGDTFVVGAPGRGLVSLSMPGRAYAFTKNGRGWVEQRLPIDGGFDRDGAGRSVAISGDTIVIGAPALDDERILGPGAVHVFRRTDSTFAAAETLSASDSSPADGFGFALTAIGDRLLVGAPFSDAKGPDVGAVHFFEQTEGGFVETESLTPEQLPGGIEFGASVAASQSAFLAGTADIQDQLVYAYALLGVGCDDDGGCESGACVDGVCCEQRCDAACFTCTAPGNEGHCVAVEPSTPDATCDAFVCGDGGACKTACESTADCAAAHACDAAGRCVTTGSDAPEKEDDAGCTVGEHVAGFTGAIGAYAMLGAALSLLRRRASRQCEKFM